MNSKIPYILNESVINAFLKIFGLRIEEGQDFKPGKILEIICGKAARGIVNLEKDVITIEAYTELGKLNASYQVLSTDNLYEVKPEPIKWNVPIEYSIKRQLSDFKGRTLLTCANNIESGFQVSIYNLLEHYINGEIQRIIKSNPTSFAVEEYKHSINYTMLDKIEMKPFDTKNGFILHETSIREDEQKCYRQTSYSGIFMPEDKELKDVLQAFKVLQAFGCETVVTNELYPINKCFDDTDKSQTRIVQMGTLMGKLNPNTYTLLKDIRCALNLGKTSLLDGLVDSSLDLKEEEFQALFGTTKSAKKSNNEEKKMNFKPVK